jgi:hypothetical protein
MATEGSKQTDADRRFTELRAAGHTGWINADGEIPTTGNTDPELLKQYEAADRAFQRHGA